MKFKITLKDPDGFGNAIEDAANEEVVRLANLDDAIDDRVQEIILSNKKEFLSEFLSRWVEYGEYITIEFDTETGTVTVLEQ